MVRERNGALHDSGASPDVLAIELAIAGRINRAERVSQALDAGGAAVDGDLGLPRKRTRHNGKEKPIKQNKERKCVFYSA